MAIYWPSCVVDLTVRFDDSFNVNEERDLRSTEQYVQEAPRTLGPATVRPLVTSTSRLPGEAGPLTERGTFASNPLVTVANRIPISCSVDMPGPRAASTFNLTMAYRDFPIDPRIAKGASIEIYMGAVDPTDFATGMTRVEADGRRTSILATHTRSGQRRDDLLLMVGIVDSWRVKHSGNASTIEMSGRDLRGRLLDAQVDQRIFTGLKLNRPVDEVVRDIIAKHPEFTNLQVVADVTDWFPDATEIPHVAVKDGSTRNRRRADGDGLIFKPMGSNQVSFWDMVTYYCYLVGAIPFFFTDKLIIKPAASLYKQRGQDKEGASNTPFAGGRQRQLPGGQPFGVRRMVFGRDVLEYSFERRFTGKKRPPVQVVSVDTSSDKRGLGKRIHVTFPDPQQRRQQSQSAGGSGGRSGDRPLGSPNKGKATYQTPGGVTNEEPLTVRVEGVRDEKTLRGIAQAIWEEIGRGELGGSVQTRSLASFGTDPNDQSSGNQDPDLLRLRPLDAVEILVDLRDQNSGAPLTSSYVDSRGRREFNEEVDEIAARLGNNDAARQIARVIVAQSRGGILNLQTFFRVGTAHFQFSGSGIAISFDFQNYIEVAADNSKMATGQQTLTSTDLRKIANAPASQPRSRT